MGFLHHKPSGCSCGRPRYIEPTLPNPDPAKFIIQKHYIKGSFIAVWANYTGCTNYEGNKIMIFKTLPNDNGKAVLQALILDPHFCEKHPTRMLIARLIPTNTGWRLAKHLVDKLDIGEKEKR